MKTLYWFVDKRDGAKNKKPFAISNKDVARSWKNEEDGHFKEVEQPDNYNPSKKDGGKKKDSGKKKDGSNEGGQDPKPSPYDDMNNDERKAELDARGVEYPSKATKDELIALLVEDDQKGD